MPFSSIAEGEAGAQGQIIAFLIASGYFPSFGPSRKMPRRKFSFQNDPITGPPVGVMGLLDKNAFTGAGVFPSGTDLTGIHRETSSGMHLPTYGKQRRPMHQQKEQGTYFTDPFRVGGKSGVNLVLASLGGMTETRGGGVGSGIGIEGGRRRAVTFADQYRGRASVRGAIIADMTNRLRGTLISKAARYRLRGNYVWWNSGTDDLDTKELAEEVYDYMTFPDPSIWEPKRIRDREARAGKMYDIFMNEFEHFERVGGGAQDMTREMVNTMVEQDLSQEAMVEYATSTFRNALSADVPEEDASGLLDYMQNITYLEAEEQFGTGNKTDILMRVTNAAGQASEIEVDASESLLGIADEYSIGKHGWVRAFSPPLPRAWATVFGDGTGSAPALIAERIGSHMIEEINTSYNPVIQEVIEYTREFELAEGNLQPGEVPTLAQIMGPLSSKSATVAGNRLSTDFAFNHMLSPHRGATPTFFSESTTSSPRGGTGADFLAAVQAGHFTETQRLIQAWPPAATGGIMQYIFKMMSALGQDTGREFLQSQRITKRNPQTGEAYYAFIPMSSFTPGDTGFNNSPYEFRTSASSGKSSPAETFIETGMSATLALFASRNALNGANANVLHAVQRNFFFARKAHSDNVRLLSDGSLLSTNNAATEAGNKHAFTMSWSPRDLNTFFTNFIQRIRDGMEVSEVKRLADKALNPQRLGVGRGSSSDSISHYKGFWALPYIGFEDNLARKSDEAISWFNEAQEKIYGGAGGAPAPGGRWMSPAARIYAVPR